MASASPARSRLLTQAGIAHEVRVSGVDESTLSATTTGELVVALAAAKAAQVAETAAAGEIVLGCDSLLDIDGTALGKPATADEALARWRVMRGGSGTLLTGHALVAVGADGSRRRTSGLAATVVRFGMPDDEEIEAYVGTGEPLAVAGAFTLDGWSAPFVDGVDGDPGNVIGLSLPLLRKLLGELGVRIMELWA